MSLKLETIYNYGGGGGGGYKDGGQIVDADFMELENNAVSSYENISRDTLNFYYEPKEGEILNAIVELKTAVNATINVYIVNNGVGYFLGYIGSNAINAGDYYKVIITANSFEVEQVNIITNDPGFVIIDDIFYGVKKINNLLWLTDNLKYSGFNFKNIGGNFYYPEQDININGWRLPTKAEIVYLDFNFAMDSLKAKTTWREGYNGNNSSGLNFKAFGHVRNDALYNIGDESTFLFMSDYDIRYASISYNSSGMNLGGVDDNFYSVRLCKDA